jgi:hypothetical protein
MNTNISVELEGYMNMNEWGIVSVHLWEIEGYFQAQMEQCEGILDRLDERDQCVSSPILELMFFYQRQQEYYRLMREAHYSEKEDFPEIGRVDQESLETNPVYIHHLETLNSFVNSDEFADGAARRQNEENRK